MSSIEGYPVVAIRYAAEEGHLEVLKWLHGNLREKCSGKAMKYAAGLGQLEIVKWLYVNCKNISVKSAVNRATEENQVEVVKWFYENCHQRPSVDALQFAAFNQKLDIVEWLYLHDNSLFTRNVVNYCMSIGGRKVNTFLKKRFDSNFEPI